MPLSQLHSQTGASRIPRSYAAAEPRSRHLRQQLARQRTIDGRHPL